MLYTGRIQAQWASEHTGRDSVDIGEIRLANLLALMGSLPRTQADLARDMGTAPAYLSQIINRHRGRRMGASFARRVEAQYGLERGYMDREHTDSMTIEAALEATGKHRRLSETAIGLGHKFDSLTEPSKSQVRAIIERFDALENSLKKKSKT